MHIKMRLTLLFLLLLLLVLLLLLPEAPILFIYLFKTIWHCKVLIFFLFLCYRLKCFDQQSHKMCMANFTIEPRKILRKFPKRQIHG